MNLINKLNRLYRNDDFLKALFNAVNKEIEKLQNLTDEANDQFFFDKLTLMLEFYENLLGLTPTALQTIDDRRSAVQARWKASGHNYIGLLQKIAESWKKGETIIDFIDGHIHIEFTNIYGVPADLNTLLKSFESTKPAHIGYSYKFKYLLKENIHNLMTKTQMETHRKNEYTGAEI